MDKLSIPAGQNLAHAYIMASPNEEQRNAAAARLAAAMLCESADAARPCGRCAACRKSLQGIHPDIIYTGPGTDGQGRKKREITVDAVRAITADALIVPNEAARKVYVIQDADVMNAQAQNALLKLLEEPPERVSFVLCAGSASRLLPTVRSRCELLRVNADAAESEEASADAKALLGKLFSGSECELAEWCLTNDGMDNRRCEAMLRAAREQLADLLPRSRDRAACVRADALLARCAEYLSVNVSAKSVLGLIAVDGIEK